MHSIRAQGIDPVAERLCDRVARSIALSWAARNHTVEDNR
jgi:hypothetical protein